MDFDEVAAKTAEMIQAGGLRVGAEYSQVSYKCFAQLADINRLGFVTIDSQEGLRDERAYVTGFVQPGRAERFVERLNVSGDMVALVLRPNARYVPDTNIAVTRQKQTAVTKIPLLNSKADINGLQKEAGIAKSQKVLLVDCFDPKWGRKAYATDGVFAAVISALHRTA